MYEYCPPTNLLQQRLYLSDYVRQYCRVVVLVVRTYRGTRANLNSTREEEKKARIAQWTRCTCSVLTGEEVETSTEGARPCS